MNSFHTSYGTLSLRANDLRAGVASLDEAADMVLGFDPHVGASLTYRGTPIVTGTRQVAFFIARRQWIQARRAEGMPNPHEHG